MKIKTKDFQTHANTKGGFDLFLWIKQNKEKETKENLN